MASVVKTQRRSVWKRCDAIMSLFAYFGLSKSERMKMLCIDVAFSNASATRQENSLHICYSTSNILPITFFQRISPLHGKEIGNINTFMINNKL